MDDCVNCPNEARCKNGAITECFGNYIIENQKCVYNQEFDLLKEKMLKILQDKLALLKGNSICFRGRKDYLMVTDLEQNLSEFKEENQFLEAVDDLRFMLMYDSTSQNHIIVKSLTGEYDFKEQVMSVDNPTFSGYCQVKLFWSKNQYYIYSFLFAILFVIIRIANKKKQARFEKKALELYKRIL